MMNVSRHAQPCNWSSSASSNDWIRAKHSIEVEFDTYIRNVEEKYSKARITLTIQETEVKKWLMKRKMFLIQWIENQLHKNNSNNATIVNSFNSNNIVSSVVSLPNNNYNINNNNNNYINNDNMNINCNTRGIMSLNSINNIANVSNANVNTCTIIGQSSIDHDCIDNYNHVDLTSSVSLSPSLLSLCNYNDHDIPEMKQSNQLQNNCKQSNQRSNYINSSNGNHNEDNIYNGNRNHIHCPIIPQSIMFSNSSSNSSSNLCSISNSNHNANKKEKQKNDKEKEKEKSKDKDKNKEKAKKGQKQTRENLKLKIKLKFKEKEKTRLTKTNKMNQSCNKSKKIRIRHSAVKITKMKKRDKHRSRVNNNINNGIRKNCDMYHCDQCDKTFFNRIEIENHIQLQHKSIKFNKPYQCKICHKPFSKRKYLLSHTKKQHDKNKKSQTLSTNRQIEKNEKNEKVEKIENETIMIDTDDTNKIYPGFEQYVQSVIENNNKISKQLKKFYYNLSRNLSNIINKHEFENYFNNDKNIEKLKKLMRLMTIDQLSQWLEVWQFNQLQLLCTMLNLHANGTFRMKVNQILSWAEKESETNANE